MVYLITHGEKAFGPDPVLSRKGTKEIERLKLPEGIILIVAGTGKRFRDILRIVCKQLPGIPVKHSPFCGSADSLEANKKDVTLADGTTVSLDDYISIENDCFDVWDFIFDLPDKTLLCAGGELMIALGLGNINEKGQLYEINSEEGTGKKIS